MPRGDGTGPLGLGPMTGRAAGYCAGYPVPGYMNPIPGFGFWRWGRGRGWRRWAFWPFRWYAANPWVPATWPAPVYGLPPAWGTYGAPPVSREQRLDTLRAQAEYLEEMLQEINEEIKQLEKEEEQE